MRVGIFTEVSRETGYGHFYRCLAISEAIADERDIQVDFHIAEKDYKLVGSHSTHPLVRIVATNWLQNGDTLASYAQQYEYSLIDSYKVTQETIELVEQSSTKALFIDDYHHWEYKKSLMVDWTVGVEYAVPPEWQQHSNYLLGFHYAVLRKPFRRPHIEKTAKEVKHILILLGGSDIRGLSHSIANAVHEAFPQLEITVLASNSDTRSHSQKIQYVKHVCAEILVTIMRKADIAICGSGQTSYELLSQNVPFIPISLVENQEADLAGWQRTGFVPYTFRHSDPMLLPSICRSIDSLAPAEIRSHLSTEMKRVTLQNGIKNLLNAWIS